jgi:acyl-coenzyme A thioesterase 13
MKPENIIDFSRVKGNASPEIKLTLLNSLVQLSHRDVLRPTGKPFRGFAAEFVSRMTLAEASILSKAEEPDKLEGRTVFQVIADEGALDSWYTLCSLTYHGTSIDMTNELVGTTHGGCLAMMIELHVSSTHVYLELICILSCSPTPIYVLRASTGAHGVYGVQQSLNIVFHSPVVPYVQIAH